VGKLYSISLFGYTKTNATNLAHAHILASPTIADPEVCEESNALCVIISASHVLYINGKTNFRFYPVSQLLGFEKKEFVPNGKTENIITSGGVLTVELGTSFRYRSRLGFFKRKTKAFRIVTESKNPLLCLPADLIGMDLHRAVNKKVADYNRFKHYFENRNDGTSN
jgi:hypothetical protein